MSTPETIVDNVEVNDDLDAFNLLLHSKEAPKAQEKDDGPESENEDDVDALIEQSEETQEDGDDTPAPEEEEKPKLTPTQKRINQLLERERLALERADRAEAELAKRPKDEAPADTPKPKLVVKDDTAPKPDDKNEDGTDKYPLGQFDEGFQEDRFNYMMEKALSEQKAKLEQDRKEQELQQARDSLNNEWNAKLEPARERYPDFQEKGEELLETFSGLDQEYGEYLANTIMGMEYGPDVLYHLSTNVEEAQRIVKLGPLGATLALGRIEAQYASNNDSEEDKPKPRPKTSKAPVPPPRNKGTSTALPEVPDDTDDLDAFSAKLFKKG